MLLMLFFHVSFSQNENSHWCFSLEGNNSIRYSYIPPNTNPGPNQTYRPVGTSYKSNWGMHLTHALNILITNRFRQYALLY